MMRILITGANRGIGLEFVKQYIASGADVIACCRKPGEASDLLSLRDAHPGKLTIIELDVSDFSKIEAVSQELEGAPIDILINNAGVYLDKGRTSVIGGLDYNSWRETFEVNLFAPLKMVESFLPNLKVGTEKKVAFLSSLMGSITDNSSGGSYFYRSSKTALNSAMRSLAMDIKSEGISVVSLHPGWVMTDMGGAGANLSTEDSVSGMRNVIQELDANSSGSFINYDGRALPW